MSDDQDRPTTTTDSGARVASDERSLTVGPNGPTVLHDHSLVQKLEHFNRERIPERRLGEQERPAETHRRRPHAVRPDGEVARRDAGAQRTVAPSTTGRTARTAP
jgi:hypothetical protein